LVRKHNYARQAPDARRAYPMAARIRNEGGAVRIDLFDEIGEGLAGGISALSFAEQLAGITGPLDVHVNSCGGDCFDGLTIYNSIKAHKGRVSTIVDGIAASIASIIIQAADERVMRSGSMAMIHEAAGLCVGNAAEMAKMTETLDKVSGNLASVYAARCGGPAASWRAAMKAETWYTAEEAVAAGLADRVGTQPAALPDSIDLAALGVVPGQIAARLGAMTRPGDSEAARARRRAAAFASLTPAQKAAMVRQAREGLATFAAHRPEGSKR
jgi:ATP-dependent protease ClpP protease subunit